MQYISDLLSFLKENAAYLTIPFVSAFVGWFTNWLALKMTFYPVKYFGIKPFGWQGIIPSKAKKMAETAVDLWTSKLLNLEDEFARIKPDIIAEEMKPAIDRLSREIIEEVMKAQLPLIWKASTPGMKADIYNRVSRELPLIVAKMMEEVKNHFSELLDLKSLAVSTLTQNRELLNQVFIKCGYKEFKFIEKSGFYFGFIFGLVQMVVWYFFPVWWTLPVAGFMVGFFTNDLALKLIFRPLNPIKLGKLEIQGLFIKRQNEVSEEYSRIVAARVITIEHIFEYIIRGPGREKLTRIVEKQMEKTIADAVGNNKKWIDLMVGENIFYYIRNIATFRFMQELPMNIRHVFGYAENAMNLEYLLKGKMKSLSPAEFEAFLRPVFKEDELTLILVGAVLGGLAGLSQYLILFS
ncbi:MAG: hypothetical protein JJU28_16410 [Cyclobacteriaceae bacterium]|nr:hypothetical protein [Cyclobacteriaceae bacterium]